MSATPIRTLLVTHSDDCWALVRGMLVRGEHPPFAVARAERLDAALAELTAQGADVVLVDLSLPDPRGMDAFRAVAAHPLRPPVILLASLDDEALAEKALLEGAQDYLVNDRITGDNLVRSIRYAIERGQSDRLRDAERALLNALMDNLPDSIYFKDLDSRFTRVNAAVARLFGLPRPEDAIGKSDRDFFSDLHASQALADEQEIIRTGRPIVNKEEQETWPDGRVTWVSSTKLPLRDAAGRIVGTFGLSRNVTERKESEIALREGEERYYTLLATVPSYTYTVHMQEGRPASTRHGPGCLGITGYAPDEYAADPWLWLTMVHPDDRDAVAQYAREKLAQPDAGPLEHRIVRKDGGVRWVRNTLVRRFDPRGQLDRYDGLVEDITARKEAELALRRAHDELELRVRERTAELARANARLGDAIVRLRENDRARSAFVSNVTHDLRSPLASMHYVIDNLLDDIPCPLPEGARAYLLMLKDSCRRLENTIGDILDMGRIEAGTLKLRRTRLPIGRLVARAVDGVRVLAERKEQRIALQPLPDGVFVDGDADKLSRTVRNIVDNAIKFTPESGCVGIRVRLLPEPGAQAPREVCIEVVDSGVGIAPENLPRVTERYFRASEDVSGTGLGLAICKEITRMHGGRMDIVSPPPGFAKGTLVAVTLPVAPPPSLLVVAADAATPLVGLLGARGYRVRACAGGGDLLEALRASSADLAIAVFAGDEPDQMEAIARLRTEPDIPRCPILAVGGVTALRPVTATLSELGVTTLAAPWSEDSLLDRVTTSMAGARPA